MKYLLAFALVLGSIGFARAKIKTETVEYKHGDVVLEGHLAYDDSVKDKRPVVLVVHEWMGLGINAQSRAQMLAKLGYLGFAVDMYGKGVRPKNNEEAAKLAATYKSDRNLMRGRIRSALEFIQSNSLSDSKKIAAIGYCFGGTVALELARSGADLKGVASFHGGLSTPTPQDAKNIKAKVLACHGANDPFVPKDEVLAFAEEMRNAGVDWQFLVYGGAVHSFTAKEAGNDPAKGAAYNQSADRRSWEALKLFLEEIFKS